MTTTNPTATAPTEQERLDMVEHSIRRAHQHRHHVIVTLLLEYLGRRDPARAYRMEAELAGIEPAPDTGAA